MQIHFQDDSKGIKSLSPNASSWPSPGQRSSEDSINKSNNSSPPQSCPSAIKNFMSSLTPEVSSDYVHPKYKPYKRHLGSHRQWIVSKINDSDSDLDYVPSGNDSSLD